MPIHLTTSSNQEVFDRAVDYFKKATRRCMDQTSRSMCSYNNGEGGNCVAGDQMDKPPTVKDLIDKGCENTRLLNLIETGILIIADEIDAGLLIELQSVHDSRANWDPTGINFDGWRLLKSIGVYYKLNISNLPEEVK